MESTGTEWGPAAGGAPSVSTEAKKPVKLARQCLAYMLIRPSG